MVCSSLAILHILRLLIGVVFDVKPSEPEAASMEYFEEKKVYDHQRAYYQHRFTKKSYRVRLAQSPFQLNIVPNILQAITARIPERTP